MLRLARLDATRRLFHTEGFPKHVTCDSTRADAALPGHRQRELLQFTRYLIRLRKRHPVLRRRQFFYGRRIRGSEGKDLAWFRPDGKEMKDPDWQNPHTRCLGLRLAGDAIEEVDQWGNRIVDETLLILLNAHHARRATSPQAPSGRTRGPSPGTPRARP